MRTGFGMHGEGSIDQFAFLNLTEDQRKAVQELTRSWTDHMMAEEYKPPTEQDWRLREHELRALLTYEQQDKLHKHYESYLSDQWDRAWKGVAERAGIPHHEQEFLRSSLDDYRIPSNVLLPSAHKMDWMTMHQEADKRVRPLLTADQKKQLGKTGANPTTSVYFSSVQMTKAAENK